MNAIEKLIDKHADEEIIFFVRRHWLPLLWYFVFGGLLIVLPFFLMFYLFTLGTWGIVAFFLLLVTGIVFLLRLVVSWHNSVFVITDKRVVDVTQKGFFDQSFSEAIHDHVMDVSLRKQGLTQHIFNYGTLTVQTWSSTFLLKDIYKPIRVQQRILSETSSERTQKIDHQGKLVSEKKSVKSQEDEPLKENVTLSKEEAKKLLRYVKEHVDQDTILEEFFSERKGKNT